MDYQFKGIQAPWVVLPDYSKVVSKNENYHNDVTVCHFSTKGKLIHRDKVTPHLIATAPELLQRAIMVVKSDNPLALHESIELLREAIHKALNLSL